MCSVWRYLRIQCLELIACRVQAPLSMSVSQVSVCVVPQQGALHLQTEFGHLYVEPNEIAVIQVCVNQAGKGVSLYWLLSTNALVVWSWFRTSIDSGLVLVQGRYWFWFGANTGSGLILVQDWYWFGTGTTCH